MKQPSLEERINSCHEIMRERLRSTKERGKEDYRIKHMRREIDCLSDLYCTDKRAAMRACLGRNNNSIKGCIEEINSLEGCLDTAFLHSHLPNLSDPPLYTAVMEKCGEEVREMEKCSEEYGYRSTQCHLPASTLYYCRGSVWCSDSYKELQQCFRKNKDADASVCTKEFEEFEECMKAATNNYYAQLGIK